MLSYQHSYHAGSFADIVKHITLMGLLEALTRKDKPAFYLETHAGRGMYDLHHQHAVKTGEALEGIQILWDAKEKMPALVSKYLDLLHTRNKEQKYLRYYPGSPWFAIQTLRSHDRLFCCELHPKEFQYLETLPRQGKRVFYSHSNGLEQMRALLPPPERRGLIFIDPAYEQKTEYRKLSQLLQKIYPNFTTGVYCIWYPIIEGNLHETLLRGLGNIPNAPHLRIEFYADSPKKAGMRGCGLWIINPPYLIKETLKPVLDTLIKIINPKVSSYYLGE